MKYFVIPETLDGCVIPTQPDPVRLPAVGEHIRLYIARYKALQGWFTNCKGERLNPDRMQFRIVPEDQLYGREGNAPDWDEAEEHRRDLEHESRLADAEERGLVTLYDEDGREI